MNEEEENKKNDNSGILEDVSEILIEGIASVGEGIAIVGKGVCSAICEIV